jgi:SAM-dependent methyltransferase
MCPVIETGPVIMSAFNDHFSGVAGDYRRYRPSYSPVLFDHLAAVAPARRLAWDCGSGSGQAAQALLDHFEHVVATDASAPQLLQARELRLGRICCLAEAVPLAAGCADLVTVAQALHWFDRQKFFTEVKRILAPGGILAVWAYQLLRVSPELDEIIDLLYGETLAADWPAQRRLVETGYREIEFPFDEFSMTAPAMWAKWSLADLMGYLSTWSAVTRYRRRTGSDPLSAVGPALKERWPRGVDKLPISWPVAMRTGRV